MVLLRLVIFRCLLEARGVVESRRSKLDIIVSTFESILLVVFSRELIC